TLRTLRRAWRPFAAFRLTTCRRKRRATRSPYSAAASRSRSAHGTYLCSMSPMGQRQPDRKPLIAQRSPRLILLAWSVHLYTALGLIAAAVMAVLIVRGEPASFRAAFLLMIVATLIDATDGTLARAVHVKTVLPGFDGRRLDDLIDFINYTFLPLFLIWR